MAMGTAFELGQVKGMRREVAATLDHFERYRA